MSDQPFAEVNPFAEPAAVSPDFGAADPGGEPAVQPAEEPQRSYLEIDDDVANRYVRVKVDGNELEVPLTEALSGYSRTADYTRKTQELASQREQAQYALAIEQALRSHPTETLQLLAREYGVDALAPEPTAPDPYADDNPYLDPMEKRVVLMERQLAQREAAEQQRAADNALRASIGTLQQRYQLQDNDVREVVGQALQGGYGPESFEMIWRSIAFDRAAAARAQQAQHQQAQQQARAQAGQSAAALVSGSGGSATMAGTSPAPTMEGPISIQEAFAMAERQLGR